ncbi:phage tail tape measure protein [Chitiniphilus shinanonensis]|uniref:phage tail tape measure protein n=1 Tax=Chitiniphilus shinanonensis TaxID=553088 RepID=UPI00302FF12E
MASLKSIGASQFAAGGQALVDDYSDAIKQSIRLESELVTLGNIAGIEGPKLPATVGQWKQELIGLSRQTQQTQGDLQQGFGALIEKGLAPDLAFKILREAGHAATATGGDVKEIGKTLIGFHDQLAVSAYQAGRALDALAVASNAGRIKFPQLQAQIPGLASAAKASGLNLQGTGGVASLAAGMQIAGKDGTAPDQATANLKGFLAAFQDEGMAARFKKLGIRNYDEEKRKAAASADPLLYMAELVQKATGGDDAKVRKLFTDREAQGFAKALIGDLGGYRQIRDQAANANGQIQQMENARLNTTQGQLHQMQIRTDADLQESAITQTGHWAARTAAGAMNEYDVDSTHLRLIQTLFGGALWGTDRLLSRNKGGGNGNAAIGDSAAGDPTPVFVVNWPAGGGIASGVGNLAQLVPLLARAGPAAAVGAAGLGGFAYGSMLNKLMNWQMQLFTGEKDATVGGKIYDWTHGVGPGPMETIDRRLHPAQLSPTDIRTIQALPPGALSPAKVGGTIEVKVSMPSYLTGQTSVTQPTGTGVKLEATANTGRYYYGGS